MSFNLTELCKLRSDSQWVPLKFLAPTVTEGKGRCCDFVSIPPRYVYSVSLNDLFLSFAPACCHPVNVCTIDCHVFANSELILQMFSFRRLTNNHTQIYLLHLRVLLCVKLGGTLRLFVLQHWLVTHNFVILPTNITCDGEMKTKEAHTITQSPKTTCSYLNSLTHYKNPTIRQLCYRWVYWMLSTKFTCHFLN